MRTKHDWEFECNVNQKKKILRRTINEKSIVGDLSAFSLVRNMSLKRISIIQNDTKMHLQFNAGMA